MSFILPTEKSSFLVIAARPASGKSHLIKYLLLLNHPDYTHTPFAYGIVFTNTAFNKDYESFIPAEFIHSQYDPVILENLMKIQENQINSTGQAPRAFVIFDDMLNLKMIGSQLFLNLSTQYRHFNITVILSSQYIYRVSTVARECATAAVLFKQTTKRSIEALFESYGGGFDSLKEFSAYLNKLEKYQFVSYDPNNASIEKNELYPISRCPANIPPFKFEY